MSYKKSRLSNTDDELNQVSSQLSRDDQDLELNLVSSVKLLSRHWLQEAYLDGMMFADKLHQLLADRENPAASRPLPTTQMTPSLQSGKDDLSLAVRQELEKMGIASQTRPSSTTHRSNSFGNVVAGLTLILLGSFALGGAISYYNLGNLIQDNSTAVTTSNSTTDLSAVAIPEATVPIPGEIFNSNTPAVSTGQTAANTQTLQTPPQSPSPVMTSSTSASSQSSMASSCPTIQTGSQNFNFNNTEDRAALRCALDQFEAQQK